MLKMKENTWIEYNHGNIGIGCVFFFSIYVLMFIIFNGKTNKNPHFY